jgi:predicted RNase H-like nuclease (RuvC/YqgF family)
MTLKPLDVLKKGLSKITQNFKGRKDELKAKLARKESISSSDERWLDHEGNTVDEQRVIDTLEAASDYERGLERLDEPGKAIVKKLREWAGDLAKVAVKKRKRTYFFGRFLYINPC